MNNINYKAKTIEKNDLNTYNLKRETEAFQIIYKTKVNIQKYRQNYIQLPFEVAKRLYVGLFVDGEGILPGTYVKRIVEKKVILSGFILKFSKSPQDTIEISFKCKLSSKQRWLDWDKRTWKEKIKETKEKLDFKEFKRQDDYFLRVKNYYDSTCLYRSYFVYDDEKPPVSRVKCGDYINELPVNDELYCGQYKNELPVNAELFCDFYQNHVDPSGNLNCGNYQNHEDEINNLNCNNYASGLNQLEKLKNCDEKN